MLSDSANLDGSQILDEKQGSTTTAVYTYGEGLIRKDSEVPLLDGHGTDAPRTSELGEAVVVSNHAFYDFEAKYLAENDVRLDCPADVPAAVADRIREMSVLAFEAAGCEGLARVDFFYTPSGDVVIN